MSRLGIFVGLVCLGMTPNLWAKWDLVPTLSLQSGYDDNITVFEEAEDGIVNRGTFQLGGRNTLEKGDIQFAIGGTYVNYSSTDLFSDSSATFLRLSADRNLRRGAIGFQVNAQRDDFLTVFTVADQGLGDVPGDLFFGGRVQGPLDINANAIENQIDRTRFRFSPYYQYQIGERSSARVYYTFSQLEYESVGNELGFRDNERNLVGFNFLHDLSERTQIGFDLTGSLFEPEPETNGDTETVEARVALSHKVSSTVQWNFYLGGRQVENDVDTQSGELLRVEYARQLKGGDLNVAAERSLFPSSFGNIIEGDTFTLRYRKRLAEKLRFLLQLQAVSIESDVEFDLGDNRDFFSISPRLSYRFARNWSFLMQYTYRFIDREFDEARGFDTAESNAFSIGFEYQPRKPL